VNFDFVMKTEKRQSKLLDERGRDGEPAKKGDRIVYILRFSQQSDESPPYTSGQADYLPEKMIRLKMAIVLSIIRRRLDSGSHCGIEYSLIGMKQAATEGPLEPSSRLPRSRIGRSDPAKHGIDWSSYGCGE